MTTKTSLSLVIFLSGISLAWAFPKGCQPTGFSFTEHYLFLSDVSGQQLFLIQNKSLDLIEIKHHERADEFMSPSLTAKIHANNWSAFASNIPNLGFECYRVNQTAEGPDTSTLISCAEALNICQYPRVKFALSNMGNYWVTADKPQADVIKDVADQGIYLRW
ncbi:MAG: enhanced entry protein EnhB [Legionellaceae bacterium]|nr:enhanced entry protein EnhB [Legionellaceae bacterium]